MALKRIEGDTASIPWRWRFDVFISFRGEDTRKNFTDHLYTALNQRGIMTFRDDLKLDRGKAISTELLKAIEGSRICIVVFSKNYATSSWCLDELLKIVECRKDFGQIVLPVFYYVDPLEVTHQRGDFEKAFADHEDALKGNMEKVAKWRKAMAEVASLSGWNLRDRHEATVIQEITEEILRKLGHSLPSVTDDLVGVEPRLEQMLSILKMGLNDVRVMGIFGMGGIGKTTLARIIYEMFCSHFEGCSFVDNVREVSGPRGHGLAGLQHTLISQVLIEKDASVTRFSISRLLKYKRVLIVLDDVSELEQLETLAGKIDWFGPGSRIIITTRDKHLLTAHGVAEEMIYKAKELISDEALLLLSWRAFNANQPPEDYKKLSQQIVSYSSGLPLAIKVLGSFLCDRSIAEWESTLKRLKENPERKIFDVLKISYDGLTETEKKMFLDIACFFKQEYVEPISKILESSGCFPDLEIGVLVQKCLITIDNKMIWMHDLLEEMGLTIVRQESLDEPGQRSRLWLHDDICHVLTEKTGSEKVECIYLKRPKSVEIRIDADAFSKMKKLRLLKIQGLQPTKGLGYLSNELLILDWEGCPLKLLPPRFKPEKLMRFSMPRSRIEQLWKGSLKLQMLRVIELSYSIYLSKIPDLGGAVNLEELILEGCVKLYELHPSVGELRKLIILNLRYCRNLRSLPDNISGLKSLKNLDIGGCTKIENLPENIGELECLEELDLSKTVVRKLSSSIVLMKNLRRLSVRGWQQSNKPLDILLRAFCFPGIGGDPIGLVLPSSFSGLRSLTELDLSDCSLSEGAIPNDIGQLSALKKLDLSRNNFVTLPESINQLCNLKKFKLEYCPKLRALPEPPSSIEELDTINCPSLETITGPSSLGSSETRSFTFNNCFKLADGDHNKNVAIDLLRNHINWVALVRLHFLCATFLKMVDEGQGMNTLTLAPLKKILRSLIDFIFKGDCNPASVIPRLEIYLPGSEIPNWFTYQSNCDSVNIGMPPNWWNNIQFLGIAFCVSFTLQDEDPSTSSEHVYKFHFNLVFNQGKRTTIIFGTQRNFGRERLAASDHLFLVYVPFDKYFQKQDWPHVEAHFRCQGPGMKYKACGINLVFFSDADNPLAGLFQGIDITAAARMLNLDITTAVGMLNSHGGLGNPHIQVPAIDQGDDGSQPQNSSHDYEEAGHNQSGSESNQIAGFDPLGLQSKSDKLKRKWTEH